MVADKARRAEIAHIEARITGGLKMFSELSQKSRIWIVSVK